MAGVRTQNVQSKRARSYAGSGNVKRKFLSIVVPWGAHSEHLL